MTNLKYGEYLVIDPCYIKAVSDGIDSRFDAIKCVKTLHEGDDGCYEVILPNGDTKLLGVDSGRLWIMRVEFDCEADIDSGLSGHLVLPADTDINRVRFENRPYTQDEWETFKRMDTMFLREDIELLAEQLGYTLDNYEINRVIDLYEDRESMEYAKGDTLTGAIEEVVKERE